MRFKKAQAAMEFLMTYGWAILVVLIVIGALAYFGIFNVEWLIPERCTFEAGLKCQDVVMYTGADGSASNITFQILNSLGEDMKVTGFTLTTQAGGTTCNALQTVGTLAPAVNWVALSPTATITVNSGELTIFHFNSSSPPGNGYQCTHSGVDIGTKPGKKMKFDMALTYLDTTSGFAHTVNGEALIKVQKYV